MTDQTILLSLLAGSGWGLAFIFGLIIHSAHEQINMLIRESTAQTIIQRIALSHAKNCAKESCDASTN